MHPSLIENSVRTVAQLQEELKARLHDLRSVLVRPEGENKKLRAEQALAAAKDVVKMFHKEDLPRWFGGLVQSWCLVHDSDREKIANNT